MSKVVKRRQRTSLPRPPDDKSLISSSWKRCSDTFGLDPEQRISTVVLSHGEFKERRDRMGHLLDTATEEMTQLLEAVGRTGYAMLLTDPNGIILKNVCDPNYDPEFRAAGLWNGADWGEAREGTNGIGTCIAERRPVTVHLDEHYFRYNSELTCTAAPIFDPRGDLLAVLDSSSCRSIDSRAAQSHLRALLCMTAGQMSNRTFLWEYRRSVILHFHTRYEYVGQFNEGLIALDNAGCILAANDSAVSMLGRRDRTDLVNSNISNIVDTSIERLMACANRPVSAVWTMHDVNSGSQFFAMAICARKEAKAHGRGVGVQADGEQCLTLADVAGDDPQMCKMVAAARKVMNKSLPIMLIGETGTGKEVCARAIHAASARAKQPFIAVNCSAIPEALIESELFGYSHGAFTGARRKGFKGRLLMSNGGTIFLDEIGDMPLHLQTRLLRVLEDGEVTPLGSDHAVKVDLKVISATHQNLDKMSEDGRFRADLYYRLRGICLKLVPVRERTDVKRLVLSLLNIEAGGDHGFTVGDGLLESLAGYAWPGNVRQLKNAITAALALSEGNELCLSDFPCDIPSKEAAAGACDGDRTSSSNDRGPGGSVDTGATARPLDDAERRALITALTNSRGNVSQAARDLSISRNTLYRKLRRHNISPQRLP